LLVEKTDNKKGCHKDGWLGGKRGFGSVQEKRMKHNEKSKKSRFLDFEYSVKPKNVEVITHTVCL